MCGEWVVADAKSKKVKINKNSDFAHGLAFIL